MSSWKSIGLVVVFLFLQAAAAQAGLIQIFRSTDDEKAKWGECAELLERCRDDLLQRVAEGKLAVDHLIFVNREILHAQLAASNGDEDDDAAGKAFYETAKAARAAVEKRSKPDAGGLTLAKAHELEGIARAASPRMFSLVSKKRKIEFIDATRSRIALLNELREREALKAEDLELATARAADALYRLHIAADDLATMRSKGRPIELDEEKREQDDEARRKSKFDVATKNLEDWKKLREDVISLSPGNKLSAGTQNLLGAFENEAEAKLQSARNWHPGPYDSDREYALKGSAGKFAKKYQAQLDADFANGTASLDDVLFVHGNDALGRICLGDTSQFKGKLRYRERLAHAERLLEEVQARHERKTATETDVLRAAAHLSHIQGHLIYHERF